ncbi:MAG: hypothetical protein JO138_05625 [Acidobacteriaceae bacterium]|nr:hypothetical protein [Acidobacteriaceae bacterium]
MLGPPILLGSEAKRAFERVVDYCDGWIPINRANIDGFKQAIKELREAALPALSNNAMALNVLQLTGSTPPSYKSEAADLSVLGVS